IKSRAFSIILEKIRKKNKHGRAVPPEYRCYICLRGTSGLRLKGRTCIRGCAPFHPFAENSMATDWTDRIRLRNLKFLLSLAQTRNLSHSAKLLHTTQPGLSKWLKDLEADIGLPLFERHARGLTPTSHGETLIAHARRIDAQLDRALVDMNILRDGGAGRVVIGASGAAATEAAPRAILAMAQRMPEMRIDL